MAKQQATDPLTDNPAAADSPGQDEGSVLTGQAETSKDTTSLTNGSATDEPPRWMAQLPDNLKGNESLTKFRNLADLGKSYLELNGKLGKAVNLPGEDATTEDWERFYKTIGRPENPDDYKLEKVKVPKGYERNEEFDSNFRVVAHKNGLNDKQAAELYSIVANEIQSERSKPPIRISRTVAQEQLRETFGAEYDVSLTYMKRAYRQFATPEITAVLDKTGLGNHPEVIKMFVNIGKVIGEPKFIDGQRGSTGSSRPVGSRSSAELATTLYPPKTSA